MAGTFNGIGSKYYGGWDISIDGKPGIIKTLFFCFLFIPIYPIESVIVWHESRRIANDSIYVFMPIRSTTMTSSKIPLFWPQILNIYSVISLVIIILAYGSATELSSFHIGEVIFYAICLFPPFIYYRMKKNKKYSFPFTKIMIANVIVAGLLAIFRITQLIVF
jgi:hypothetical protein